MKETVYVSAYLPDFIESRVSNKKVVTTNYGKDVYSQLKGKDAAKAIQEKIEIKEINSHNNNAWARDFMPVKGANGQWVHFIYAPLYMTDTKKWSEHCPNREALQKELDLKDVRNSNLILDGGAVEICGKKAIVSDRIFCDNLVSQKVFLTRMQHLGCSKEKLINWHHQLPKNEVDLIAQLKEELCVDEVIVVPQHPFDFTGHVDGMVRFVDENTVVISKMTNEDGELIEKQSLKSTQEKIQLEGWYHAFMYCLAKAGLAVETLPFVIPPEIKKDGTKHSYESGYGIYLNFLKLENLILMPTYDNLDENKQAKDKLEKLYKCDVIGIDATDLCEQGGMINCVTWTK